MEGEKASKLFSLKEVEEHNSSNKTEKSVWLVIHDQVFDVTKFLDEVIMTSGRELMDPAEKTHAFKEYFMIISWTVVRA